MDWMKSEKDEYFDEVMARLDLGGNRDGSDRYMSFDLEALNAIWASPAIRDMERVLGNQVLFWRFRDELTKVFDKYVTLREQRSRACEASVIAVDSSFFTEITPVPEDEHDMKFVTLEQDPRVKYVVDVPLEYVGGEYDVSNK
jgi:hypothetical protein